MQFAVSPPLNRDERAAARPFQVRQLLLAGCTYREICRKLDASYDVVHRDIKQTYRLYRVKGYGFTARRALAQKLNVPYTTPGDQTRNKILELRQSGLSWTQVAKAVGLTQSAVCTHAAKFKRQQEMAAAPADTVAQ
ncbi:MAG TPA: hypothetical protein VGP94_16855, partial [Tepidisphaeraceae bacterium]|nr:hypothetical protein [Tepidisphaeraceae bacterium]